MKRRAKKTDDPSPHIPLNDASPPTLGNSTVGPLPLACLQASFLERRRYGQLLPIFTHVVVGVIMMLFGWFSRSVIFPTPMSAPLSVPLLRNRVIDPPWWLEDTVDDFFSRRYVTGLSGVRVLNNSNFFTGMCGRYRFDEDAFPTISVIATLQNEQTGMLTLTVHTILARTPPQMLRQIIIVDDNGMAPELRAGVNESEIEALQQTSDKVLVVRNAAREGVARSRMRGARVAKGDVLVFIDSHVEMLSATWAQHLLLPIVEDGRTVAAQTLDILDDVNWMYGPGSGDLLYGVITDDFWFAYQRSRFGGPNHAGPEREKPGRRLPYETPFAAGSLFAVRRDTFFRLGGYDEGMYVWGGENTDFAIKTWTCGGRIVMVPCSRVGHMYRIHIRDTGRWPPVVPPSLTVRLDLARHAPYRVRGFSADNFTKIITRNNIRVLERWARASSARTGYYRRMFGKEVLPPEWQVVAEQMKTDRYAKAQRSYIRRNGCRDFDWFDKHVYVKLTGVHHPWHPNFSGRNWV